MSTLISSFVQLTKPSIMLLVITAGAVSLVIEGGMLADPLRIAAFMIGLYLTGGCANSLNQYFERGLDARMTRTSRRRPLPMGKLSPRQALWFSMAIGSGGVTLLGVLFNWLTAILSLGVILFYGLVYTLWLKPRTSRNIVIGGIAGAMAPVGAWAAATGSTALMPWFLFLIIFLWTPPHFWALALRFKDDYRRVGLPMKPNVDGEAATLRSMYYYSLALFGASLLPLTVSFGWLYLVTAVGFGVVFLRKAYLARRRRDPDEIWGLFKYSITYLFAILISLALNPMGQRLLGSG